MQETKIRIKGLIIINADTYPTFTLKDLEDPGLAVVYEDDVTARVVVINRFSIN